MTYDELKHLPEAFSYSDAVASGMSDRRLYSLRDTGRGSSSWDAAYFMTHRPRSPTEIYLRSHTGHHSGHCA